MSSEEETSPEHGPPGRLFTKKYTWCLKSLSDDLPSPDSCAFKTPQATRCRATLSSRKCMSSTRRPIFLDTSESEDETSELNCRPFRTPSTKGSDERPFRTPSNALRASSSKSSVYSTPQTSLHHSPLSRTCHSSVRRPVILDTSESEDETTESQCRPFRTPSTKEGDVRPFRTPSNPLRASGKSSTYSTPQVFPRRSPLPLQFRSSVRRPVILDTSDSEDGESAQHWSLEPVLSRKDDREPFKLPPSSLQTTSDNLCAFSTPQVPRCRADLPPRQCWSSAKKRPSFLDDSSSSEEENKPVARTLFARDDAAWFLESLSEDKPLEECHHRALRFRRQFRNSREDLTEALFEIFNRELFSNQLPRSEISWYGRLTSTAGRCFHLEQKRFRVELSPKLLDCAEKTRDTLLHELCHAAVWCIHGVIDGGHSHSGWKFWVDRAARRFPKLPRVQRCHNYKKGHSAA
ncbi:uncharacterized protein LOC144174867 [Haemaphysalis longicornis]